MAKKKRATLPPQSAEPPAALATPAPVPAKTPGKKLMDTLEADTTGWQLIGITLGMLAFPAAVSLLVKYLVLPFVK